MIINMNKDELQLIIEEGEGYRIEFKESMTNIDKELVAFANSSGGRIFFGITDDKEIKGLNITNKFKSQIQDIANNCQLPIKFEFDTFFTATFKRPIEKWTKKLGEKLGENEVKIIELMKENKYVTTKELSGHIKISTTAIDKNISKLKKKGILKRIGPAKGGYWEVIKK